MDNFCIVTKGKWIRREGGGRGKGIEGKFLLKIVCPILGLLSLAAINNYLLLTKWLIIFICIRTGMIYTLKARNMQNSFPVSVKIFKKNVF